MSKYFIYSLAALIITVNTAMAETYVQQIQSPIYTDEIGRAHFLGKGGYSAVRHTQMQQAEADFVNDAVTNLSNKKEAIQNNSQDMTYTKEPDITSVIKEKPTVPVSSKTEATFTPTPIRSNPASAFGRDAMFLPSSGVNDSKTIYTDDIGRLHFFGKGNLIKE